MRHEEEPFFDYISCDRDRSQLNRSIAPKQRFETGSRPTAPPACLTLQLSFSSNQGKTT